MRKILLLILSAAALYSQNPSIFPTRTSTPNDLMVAVNNGQTTLNTGISATATSLSVASGASFVAPGVVTIDNEIIAICRISGNTMTIGHSACPNVDGRGWDGSTAVSHNANRTVAGRVTAGLHNQNAAEIQAIEQAIPNQLSDLIGGYTSFPAACADATTKNLTLTVSRSWTSVASAACPNVSFVRGAMIRTATGAKVSFASIILQGGDYQVFDESVGGAGSIILKNSYVRPVWFGGACSGQAHDDSPGYHWAAAAIEATGGTLDARGGGGNCWFNSISAQVNAVEIHGSGMILDGNGATINSTLNTPGGASAPGGFVVFGANTKGQPWQNTPGYPMRTKYAFQHAGIGDTTFTVCAGCGVNFKVGDVIYTQSGSVQGGDPVSGTPFNAEGNVVAKVNGDVFTLRYPIEHQFLYSAAPDGVSIVTGDTRFNNTYENWRTGPQFQGVFMVAIQCIHCQYLNIDADLTGLGQFIVDGMMRDTLIDHVNISVTDPNLNVSPLFQYAAGMADTIIRHSNFACSGTTNNPASVVLNPSEGSSNDVFESGTISGNCPITSSTYQGFTLKDSQITLNNPLAGAAGAEITFAGAGTSSSSRLSVTGNTMVFTSTTNKTNMYVAGDQTQLRGNRIFSNAVTSVGAVITTQSCSQCVITDNTLATSGYGFVFQGIPQHSFNVVNNNVTCTAGSMLSGFFIADDGQQTVGEVVQGNTANGCGTGLTVVNPAHEIGSFTPNSFQGSTVPYSPGSINSLTISALTIAPPTGVAQMNFGSPIKAYLGTTGGNNFHFVYNSVEYGIFSPGLIEWGPPTQIDGALTIGPSTFKLGGFTCSRGTGGALSCN